MGGLFTGLALRERGHEVEIFERSTGELEQRGAGIVAQPAVAAFLDRRGIVDPDRLTTSTNRRRYLDSDGSVDREYREEMTFTSWDGVYRELRDAFPDDRYHAGREVVGVDLDRGDDRVAARLADGSEAIGDLLVAAEGPLSTTREQFLPTHSPEYAGYVAWRGVVHERDLSADLVGEFEDVFTFYEGDEGLALGYLIPGPEGGVDRGSRRLNWVWYDTVAAADLDEVLTDARGRERELSVPPGLLGDAAADRLAERTASLPPAFAALVDETDEPFVQPIVDLAVPRMAFDRVCLLGDAAFVARPHTAMGTAKAAIDAVELATAIEERETLETALDEWEDSRLSFGRRLVARGKRMGIERLA